VARTAAPPATRTAAPGAAATRARAARARAARRPSLAVAKGLVAPVTSATRPAPLQRCFSPGSLRWCAACAGTVLVASRSAPQARFATTFQMVAANPRCAREPLADVCSPHVFPPFAATRPTGDEGVSLGSSWAGRRRRRSMGTFEPPVRRPVAAPKQANASRWAAPRSFLGPDVDSRRSSGASRARSQAGGPEKSGCACGAQDATSDPCPSCMKVLGAVDDVASRRSSRASS
jgi:hypothetical protein